MMQAPTVFPITFFLNILWFKLGIQVISDISIKKLHNLIDFWVC